MTSRKPRKLQLLLTHRALGDIAEVERYSVEQWGKRTASRYLSDIEAALERVRENPEILRHEQGFHATLQFYAVNRHVLVCDTASDAIFVLTVMHGSMDIPSRLSELSPTLALEAELLHRKLQQSKRPRT